MAVARRRRKKCGFNKAGKATAGRTANGRIRAGYRLTSSGKVVPKKWGKRKGGFKHAGAPVRSKRGR